MNKLFYDNEDNNYYMIKVLNDNEASIYLIDLKQQTIHYILSIDNALELTVRFEDGDIRFISKKEEAKVRLILEGIDA